MCVYEQFWVQSNLQQIKRTFLQGIQAFTDINCLEFAATGVKGHLTFILLFVQR